MIAMKETKECRACSRTLPVSDFCRRSKSSDGLYPYCRECKRIRGLNWYYANRSQVKIYQANNRARINENHREAHARRGEQGRIRIRNAQTQSRYKYKQIVYAAYGDKCYCCGVDDYRFLTIDHILNDGMADRRSKTGAWISGVSFLKHVLDQGCPKDRYQVACCNCNMAREKAGKGTVCPHHLEFDALVATAVIAKSPHRIALFANESRRADELRSNLFQALGDRCYCCGEADYRFLTVDHINDDGYVDRKRNGRKMNTRTFYKHILSHESPGTRYRIACYNCNSARSYLGKGRPCPHQVGITE